MHRRGWHDSFVDFFCLTVPKYFGGTLLCFRKFLVWKKNMDRRGGGITNFQRKFFVSQCHKNSWGTLQCFRQFGVSKNFMHNRGVSRFSMEILLFLFPKRFVGDPSLYDKISGFCMRGISRFSVRGVARFSIDYFMSHSTETFLGDPFRVSLISGIEKFYG